ncbi:GNAT family N-acetyltransferase [Roseibium salinum]|uniref:GNAT family N-acetyltransferase n=1 Tax=Roseibium salinum TaxID=1604349 RepID=A0ABT3R6A5_9HYPH|nr:GNAT family N-acetyltransferase [Roseibium sp. DSM 29163]MCX2724821.1 GNAT family N-acetyltransferase [Roseibium sp. DSM 29163]
MSMDILLETERLLLRPWRNEDLDPLAEMCADPEVMRYFPETLSRDRSAFLISRCREKADADGFCFSPVEVKDTGEFLGFVGLSVPTYGGPLPFDPCVEIGWRLKRSAWGKSYASEASRAWLRFGYETLDLDEIVAFTLPDNTPSQAVMKRLCMSRDLKGDFLHPALPADHAMALHVLYRLTKDDWRLSDR